MIDKHINEKKRRVKFSESVRSENKQDELAKYFKSYTDRWRLSNFPSKLVALAQRTVYCFQGHQIVF